MMLKDEVLDFLIKEINKNLMNFYRTLSDKDKDYLLLSVATFLICVYDNELEHAVKKEERQMDKLIRKVEKDVRGGKKKKAEKDIKTLLKADKKHDAKMAKCEKDEKAMGKHLKRDTKTFKHEIKEDKKMTNQLKKKTVAAPKKKK